MNTWLLLALSLALNVGLGTLLILQTASRTPTAARPHQIGSSADEIRMDAKTDSAQASADPVPNYRRFFAALRATGLPRDETIRILRGAALSDWQEDLRKGETGSVRGLARLIEIRRARESALAAVTENDEFLALRGWLIGPDAWDALPPEKRKAVILIEEDYQLLLAETASASGQINANSEAVRLLREERREDLATILTENELADYEFASLPGLADLPAGFSADPPASTLADDPRASDPVFQQLYQLTRRFNLSPERAAEVYEIRRVVLDQQREIATDPDLSPEERRDALALLTGDARDVVREILGEEGFEAYVETGGPWLDLDAQAAPNSENPE